MKRILRYILEMPESGMCYNEIFVRLGDCLLKRGKYECLKNGNSRMI